MYVKRIAFPFSYKGTKFRGGATADLARQTTIGDGIVDVPELFEIDQSSNTVFLGEAGDEALLVFLHAPREVICYACVEHTRAACQDVNPVGADHPVGSWTSA